MKKNMKLPKYKKAGPFDILFGALAGSLIGAVVMLLFAPQSGKQTRALIQDKSIQLRDQTTEGFKRTIAKVNSGTHRFTDAVKGKAAELKQMGKDKLVKQVNHVSTALDTGKSAIESA